MIFIKQLCILKNNEILKFETYKVLVSKFLKLCERKTSTCISIDFDKYAKNGPIFTFKVLFADK